MNTYKSRLRIQLSLQNVQYAFCILYHSYFSIFTDKVSSLKVFFAFFDQMVAKIGPAILCHTAANTLGSAAAGPKCAVASATPNPEFCIPTSIEIALLVPSSSLSTNAVIYPSKKPNALWSITAMKISRPEEVMLLTFAETTAETIMIIAKTDMKGITVIPFVTVFGKKLLHY